MEWLLAVFESFWALTVEMAPYLLLGFAMAGILHVGVSQDYIKKHLGGNRFSSILKASLFGIPLPLCSCGVIPTGISLYQNGASKGSTVSFLISTPQTGVDSIFLTWSMLGLPFAIIRPVVALLTGVFGGVLTKSYDREIVSVPRLTSEKTKKSKSNSIVRALKYGFVELPSDIAKWLMIGMFLAALVDVFVPQDFFEFVSSNMFTELLFVLLLAVPLYVCATGSIPIAAVLIMKGISPGAALVFLMAGPATNIATMTVVGKSMGKKTLAAYLFSIIIGAIAFGAIINFTFPSSWFILSGDFSHSHEHHSGGLLNTIFGVVLVLMLVLSYIVKHYLTIKNNKMKGDITILVEGMNCTHCQNSVKTNLEQMDGIDLVDVDLKTGKVAIQGSDIDLEKVKKKVQDLGFVPK